jgi:catalase
MTIPLEHTPYPITPYDKNFSHPAPTFRTLESNKQQTSSHLLGQVQHLLHRLLVLRRVLIEFGNLDEELTNEIGAAMEESRSIRFELCRQ